MCTATTYRIWVQSTATGTESHYGDCATWAEVRHELRGNIAACGLYARVQTVRV